MKKNEFNLNIKRSLVLMALSLGLFFLFPDATVSADEQEGISEETAVQVEETVSDDSTSSDEDKSDDGTECDIVNDQQLSGELGSEVYLTAPESYTEPVTQNSASETAVTEPYNETNYDSAEYDPESTDPETNTGEPSGDSAEDEGSESKQAVAAESGTDTSNTSDTVISDSNAITDNSSNDQNTDNSKQETTSSEYHENTESLSDISASLSNEDEGNTTSSSGASGVSLLLTNQDLNLAYISLLNDVNENKMPSSKELWEDSVRTQVLDIVAEAVTLASGDFKIAALELGSSVEEIKALYYLYKAQKAYKEVLEEVEEAEVDVSNYMHDAKNAAYEASEAAYYADLDCQDAEDAADYAEQAESYEEAQRYADEARKYAEDAQTQLDRYNAAVEAATKAVENAEAQRDASLKKYEEAQQHFDELVKPYMEKGTEAINNSDMYAKLAETLTKMKYGESSDEDESSEDSFVKTLIRNLIVQGKIDFSDLVKKVIGNASEKETISYAEYIAYAEGFHLDTSFLWTIENEIDEAKQFLKETIAAGQPMYDDPRTLAEIVEETKKYAEDAQAAADELKPADDTDENTEDQNTDEESEKTRETSEDSASVSDKRKEYDDLIEGVMYGSDRVGDYDTPIRFRYSDHMFEGDSTSSEYDIDLAEISAVAAYSTSGSQRAKGYIFEDGEQVIVEEDIPMDDWFLNQSKNAQDFLRQVGFKNIEINEAYTKMGTPTTAGAIIGIKEMTDSNGDTYTLIAFMPRSTSYFGEWANSLQIGTDDTEDFEGVSSAVNDDLLPFLTEYLKEHNIQGDVKLWTAGLSRGGGLVDLMVARIDEEIENNRANGISNKLFDIEGISLDLGDIYAYVFGCPNYATTYKTRVLDEDGNPTDEYNPIYNNIHGFAATYDMTVNSFYGGWTTDHYGANNDFIVTTEQLKENLNELIKYYAAVHDMDIEDLPSNYYMYLDEDGNVRYFPADYESPIIYKDLNGNYGHLSLEDFFKSFMNNLTTSFSREYVGENFQQGLMFFGETYFGYPYEIKQFVTLDNLKTAAMGKATEVVFELYLDIITKDYEDIARVLKYVFTPTEVLPDILLDMFDNIGMVPKYLLPTYTEEGELIPTREFTEEEIESGYAREMNRTYLLNLVSSALKVALNDPTGMYNLYKAYGGLWASHEEDVDMAWLHLYDVDNQEFYLQRLSDAERWGYRMVRLPSDSEGIVIALYEGYEQYSDTPIAVVLGDTLARLGDDTFIRLTVDEYGNRFLFLRPDREYTLSFTALDSAKTTGLSMIEYEFLKSKDIYDPSVYNEDYEILVDDYYVNLGDIQLKLFGQDGVIVKDKLYYNIGKIVFEDPETGLLMYVTLDSSETPEHEAEKYTLSKLIQLGGVASVGGIVDDIKNQLFYSSNLTESLPMTLTATAASGYRFLGWYLDGQLLSTDPLYTRYFTFNDNSLLLTARFEVIPSPTPSKKDSSSSSTTVVDIPVTVQSSTTAQRTKVPNTADHEDVYQWLWLLLGGLSMAGASLYFLKQENA